MRLLISGLLLLSLIGCSINAGPEAATDGATVHVVTTMSILADIIGQVGGERVQVTNIVPLGAGPEDYQATPGDAQTIADAQIVFFNGHGLEDWLEPLFANAAPTQPRVALSADLRAIDADDPTGGNPHFWLDPTNVLTYTQIISAQLSAIDPAGAATYAANAERYAAELGSLDRELAEQAASLPAERRVLVTNHDAFPYFARHYGFTIVGVLLNNPEAELAAGDLRQLIDAVKVAHVPAIFSESQFNQKTAQLLADEAGISTIAVLYTDTLGADAGSYVEMMRYNMRTIVAALQ